MPTGGHPVSLATGTKLESATDLVVELTGADLVVEREYTSDSTSQEDWANGWGWTLSLFEHIEREGIDTDNDNVDDTWLLHLHGIPLKRKLTYEWNDSSDRWETTGPATQSIAEATSGHLGNTYNVYRLSEAGAWATEFYRAGGDTNPDLVGAIHRQVDMYGNTKHFYYDLYDDGSVLPYMVECRRAGTNVNDPPEAVVRLYWHIWENPQDPDLDPFLEGKLELMVATRYLGDGTAVITDMVRYNYVPGDNFPNSTIYSPDVGPWGNLAQVSKHARIQEDGDGTSGYDFPFTSSFTQYRYHDGDPRTTAQGETIWGRADMLKAVIGPEQVEFVAERQTTGTPTDDALRTQAELLLDADDDDIVLQEGGIDFTALDLATKVVSYIDDEGDPLDGYVEKEYISAGCGCGGARQSIRQSFEYTNHFDSNDDPKGKPTTKITEHLWFDDGQTSGYTEHVRTMYHDMQRLGPSAVPYEVAFAIEDSQGNTWVSGTSYDTDTRNVIRQHSPSNVNVYTKAVEGVNDWSITYHDAEGLVRGYAYDGHNRRTEIRVGKGVLGPFALLEKTTYQQDPRSWLVDKIERYRSETPVDGSDVETTTFAYAFHAGSYPDAIASRRTVVEAELMGENGPDGPDATYDHWALFDVAGRKIWSRDADWSLTKYAYDSRSGLLTSLTSNADPTGLNGADYGNISVSGWGNIGGGSTRLPGGTLAWTCERDLNGRVVKTVSPGGVPHYTRYELRKLDVLDGIWYPVEISLPYLLPNSSDFDGLAVFTWRNATGKVLQSSGYTPTISTYDPENGSYSVVVGNERARVRNTHNLAGQVTETSVWHDVAGDDYYTTQFEYDDQGRLVTIVDAEDTITENAAFDVFGRVLEVRVGTSDTNMETVAEHFYDHGLDGSGNPVQGVGDGYLTLTRLHTGENGGTEYRDTKWHYDYRGRLEKVVNSEAPHAFFVYDNLGRVTDSALFETEPTGIGSTGRGAYTAFSYGQRGMLYRTRTAIDPANLGAGYLESHLWYDPAGRVAAAWSASSGGVKTAYDGHGRVVASYVTDRGGDAAPGASGNYADAISLTSDTVLSQTEYTYDTDDTRWAGNLLMATGRTRIHDSAATGALDNTSAISTFTGYFYDDADRLVRSVAFGTNTAEDVYRTGGMAPSWPPQAQPEWNGAGYGSTVVSGIEYQGETGRVERTIDTLGRQTKYVYDDLSRQVAAIENYVDAEVTWSSFLGRWTVSRGLYDANALDTDRVTSYVYDGSGNIRQRVAHTHDGSSSEKVQVTGYVYGTAGDTNSHVASNSLLREVHYPDETTGEASSSSAYRVRYSYNRLGEVRWREDQNGTEHDYARDLAGRVTLDTSSEWGTSIDDRVRKIRAAFNEMGRLASVESLGAFDAVLNEVEFAYTPLGQIAKLYQDHDGEVELSSGLPSGNTRLVELEYATAAVGFGNYTRRSAMVYPTGARLEYHYGSSGSVDDDFSRVRSLTLDGVGLTDELVEYTYLGLSLPIATDYPVPDVQLDGTLGHDGARRVFAYTSQTQGRYPAFDRLGRLVRHAWAGGSLHTHNDGQSDPDATLPNRPPHVEMAFMLEPDGLIEARADARPGAGWADRDRKYEHDDLLRLTQGELGVQQGSGWTGAAGSRQWELDLLGNWLKRRTDLNADGSFAGSGEEQARTHNRANELSELSTTGVAGSSRDLVYLDNGNIRSRERSGVLTEEYTHDAWNRLVRVEQEVQAVPPQTKTVAEFEYNGLGWRVVSRTDTSLPPTDGVLDEERVLLYSPSWQVLEERIDEDYQNAPGVNRIAQMAWGLRHLDDAVLRRIDRGDGSSGAADGDFADPEDSTYFYLTDPQFGVVKVLSDTAKLQESVSYSPYGEAEHHWPGDIDGDGDLDSYDHGFMLNINNLNKQVHQAGYRVEADLNADGVVNTSDISLFLGWYDGAGRGALLSGWVSDPDADEGPDSPVGYGGYQFVRQLKAYCVRHRWLDPELGRWLQRDPAGYVDGMSLYLYGSSAPLANIDPRGLGPVELDPGLSGGGIADLAGSAMSSGSGAAPSMAYWGTPSSVVPPDPVSAAAMGVAASMLPGVGELQDGAVLFGPDSTLAERGRAAQSLLANACTAGFAPNYAAIRQADRLVDTLAKGGTYRLVDPATDQVMRTGRSKDLLRREREQARAFPELDFQIDRRTDVYAQQRGREQVLHDTYKPPLNKINPISPRNPRFDEYMRGAEEVK
jgi:RHS repeat-associated protein